MYLDYITVDFTHLPVNSSQGLPEILITVYICACMWILMFVDCTHECGYQCW